MGGEDDSKRPRKRSYTWKAVQLLVFLAVVAVLYSVLAAY